MSCIILLADWYTERLVYCIGRRRCCIGLTQVACPICARQVPEADINLHLDLQCPGEASTSSHSQDDISQSGVKAERRSSQASNKSSDDGIVAVEATPIARASGQRAGGAAGSAPVAPIFGGMRRKESEEKPSTPKDRGTEKRGQKRSSEAAVKQEGGEEKRVKVNPLLANQPYVSIAMLDKELTSESSGKVSSVDA